MQLRFLCLIEMRTAQQRQKSTLGCGGSLTVPVTWNSSNSEILTRRIPPHQIPERRQDQLGLRFDFAVGVAPLCIALMETNELPLQEAYVEGR